MRGSVACCFERPEQLQTLFVSRETFPVDNQQTGVIIGDTRIVRMEQFVYLEHPKQVTDIVSYIQESQRKG